MAVYRSHYASHYISASNRPGDWQLGRAEPEVAQAEAVLYVADHSGNDI